MYTYIMYTYTIYIYIYIYIHQLHIYYVCLLVPKVKAKSAERDGEELHLRKYNIFRVWSLEFRASDILICSIYNSYIIIEL